MKNIIKVILSIVLLIGLSQAFAGDESACKKLLELIKKDNPDITAEEMIEKICELEKEGKAKIVLVAPKKDTKEDKDSAEDKKELKDDFAAELKIAGNHHDGNTKMTLVTIDFKVSDTFRNRRMKLTLDVHSGYKETETETLRDNMVSLTNDYLFHKDASLFAVMQVGNDDSKKKELIAYGMIGIGYDFFGDYTDDKSFKVSSSIGRRKELIEDGNDVDNLVLQHRIRLKGKITDRVKGHLRATLIHTVHSYSNDDFDPSEDYETIYEGGFSIEKVLGSDADLTFNVKYTHDNTPAADVNPWDLVYTVGVVRKW